MLKFRWLLLGCGLTLALAAPAQTAAPAPPDTLRPCARALQGGIRAYQRGQFDSATVRLTRAMRLARALRPRPDTLVLLRAVNNLGNVANDQGRKPQALAAYQQALALAEASHDAPNTAKITNNIGTLYRDLGRLPEAATYLARATAEAQRLHDVPLLADCANNRGLLFEQQQRLPAARRAYEQALGYYAQKHRPDREAMVLSNLAIVQKHLNDYPASLASTRRALAVARTLGDQYLEAATLINLGNTLVEMRQPAAAAAPLAQGLRLARQIKTPELVVAVLETQAQAAAAAGQPARAYALEQAFAAARDSLVNADAHRQVSELQVKYDTQRQAHENQRLRYQNGLATLARQKAEQARRHTQQLAGGGLLGLLLLGGAGGLVQRQRRRHRETLLRTNALFSGEQQERVRLARDLHDGVGQYLAVVRMYVSELCTPGPDTEAQATHTLGLVDKAIEEVRTVSHNLIPSELNFGFARALAELGRQLGQSGTLRLSLDIADEARQTPLSREFELSLYRVVQEVVNGMVRHAEASEISIRFCREAHELVVHLHDNGKGFDPALVAKSKGLGWKNIHARVGTLGGQCRVQSRVGKGTQVRIGVPG